MVTDAGRRFEVHRTDTGDRVCVGLREEGATTEPVPQCVPAPALEDDTTQPIYLLSGIRSPLYGVTVADIDEVALELEGGRTIQAAHRDRVFAASVGSTPKSITVKRGSEIVATVRRLASPAITSSSVDGLRRTIERGLEGAAGGPDGHMRALRYWAVEVGRALAIGFADDWQPAFGAVGFAAFAFASCVIGILERDLRWGVYGMAAAAGCAASLAILLLFTYEERVRRRAQALRRHKRP